MRQLSPEAKKVVVSLSVGGLLLVCIVLFSGGGDAEVASVVNRLGAGRTAHAATSQADGVEGESNFPLPERSGTRYGLLNDITDALSGEGDDQSELVFLPTTDERRLFESWRREIANAGSMTLVFDREDEFGRRVFRLEGGDRSFGRLHVARHGATWNIVGVEPYSTTKEREAMDRLFHEAESRAREPESTP